MKTKTFLLITVVALIGLPGLKAQNLLPKLQELFGAENVIRVDSSAFKEYYKINIPQFIDHTDKNKGIFSNRILLGFNNISAPVVMESAAYGFTSKYENLYYKTELTEVLNSNQIIVEHRYFGKSIPDSTTFKYLTYKQVSDDFHHIRQKLNGIFPNKWVATGWSKGGDEVFAYKFYYPEDMEATVAYGTSLTLEKEDRRYDKFFAEKRKTLDGKKVYEDQIYLLKNKNRLLPAFIDYIQNKEKFLGANYGKYDVETIYDYGVLELEFMYWQSFGDYEKFKTGTQSNYERLLRFGYKPKILSDNFQDKLIYLLDPISDKKVMNAHFYQSFSQGGYYGYNEKPFSKYLKQKDYPLDVFAGQKTVFDNTFRLAQKKFAETEMERVMLILADTDPWSIICPIPFPPDKDNLKLVLKNSNHSLNLKDFDEETRNNAILKLKSWLGE